MVDSYPHRDVPWLKPIVAHPGAPATALALSSGLAGAYGYTLAAARQIGMLLYRWTFEGLVGLPPALYSTTPEGVGQVEGYVPGVASKIGAEVTFIALDLEEATAKCRVSTASDTGVIVNLETDLAADPARGEPYDYALSRITADLTLSATTLDDDVLVSVEFNLLSGDATRPLAAYPIAVSVWWE